MYLRYRSRVRHAARFEDLMGWIKTTWEQMQRLE